MKYHKFVENSVSKKLYTYLYTMKDQIDYYLYSQISRSKAVCSCSEDTLMQFETAIEALIDGLAEKIVELAKERGEIEHE